MCMSVYIYVHEWCVLAHCVFVWQKYLHCIKELSIIVIVEYVFWEMGRWEGVEWRSRYDAVQPY